MRDYICKNQIEGVTVSSAGIRADSDISTYSTLHFDLMNELGIDTSGYERTMFTPQLGSESSYAIGMSELHREYISQHYGCEIALFNELYSGQSTPVNVGAPNEPDFTEQMRQLITYIQAAVPDVLAAVSRKHRNSSVGGKGSIDIQIREAAREEWATVHRIMREAFEEYRGVLNPPSGALREELEDTIRKLSPRGGAVLAMLDGEAIGSAQYRVEDDYVYIGRISVLQRARGRGIGKQIVHYLEQLAADRNMPEVRLEVRLSLPSNIQLYERLGYNVLQECRYPEDTDGWYIMGKNVLVQNS